MARGVNKVVLLGNLGADPEVRHTPTGIGIARIRLATSLIYKDKQTGEQKEQTEWHRVIFFKQLAEIVEKYLKKGSRIYIEGKLRTRKWQDQMGREHAITEIIADDLRMLDSAGNKIDISIAPEAKEIVKPVNTLKDTPPINSPANDFFDDDIPF